MRRQQLGILLAVMAMSSAACQTNGMQWQRSDMLRVTSPSVREVVTLPVALRWEPDGALAQLIEDQPGQILYGIFVDRAPIGTGSDLGEVVNRNCGRPDGCMDAESLADRGIYVTVAPELLLSDLDDLRRRGDPDALDIHQATIVVLRRGAGTQDGVLSGERVDEASFRVEFVIARQEKA